MYLRWSTNILKMAFLCVCINWIRNSSDVPVANLGSDANYSQCVFSYFSSVDQANAATVRQCGHDDFHPGPCHITSHQPDCSGLWQYRELPFLCQKFSLILGTLDVTGYFWQLVKFRAILLYTVIINSFGKSPTTLVKPVLSWTLTQEPGLSVHWPVT